MTRAADGFESVDPAIPDERRQAAMPSALRDVRVPGRFDTIVSLHHDRLRTVWLWYLLPLSIGPVVIFSAGTAVPRPATAAIGPGPPSW